MSASPKIRLLIVDDSVIVRQMLQQMVEADPAIEVVGMAANGKEAVEKACQLKPDLITLDVIMPVLDGLQALKEIMRQCPTRVLMVSSMTTEGAAVTLDALAEGAVDFLPKPTGDNPLEIRQLAVSLLEKIHTVAGVAAVRKISTATDSVRPLSANSTALSTSVKVVLIGTSTGGPNALQSVIPRLPVDLPVGVLIVQHMPAAFTGQLARRLDQLSKLDVKEAEEGDEIRPGQVLLAPGHSHLIVRQPGQVGLTQEPEHLHKPAVDVLMDSGAVAYGAAALGVIMTGMGEDGKVGITALKEKNGFVIAQDQATSVVYGMPKAVFEAGLTDEVHPLEDLAPAILRRLQ